MAEESQDTEDLSDGSEEWTEGTKRPFNAGISDPGERDAIYRVLDSFRLYRKETHYSTTHRRRQNFYALPQAHQDLLKRPPINLLETLNRIDDAVDDNADLTDAILALALDTFGLPERPEKGSKLDWHNTARPLDMSKAHSTLRQFWRDWSREGFGEEMRGIRDLIIADLELVKHHDIEGLGKSNPIDHHESTGILQPYRDLLLPGAGLGRLVFELALLGYNTEGNEISYHQLFASQFVLNAVQRADKYKLYPFVSNFNNNVSRERQLKYVTIPDVHPGQTLAETIERAAYDETIQMPGQMNMTAGDFITSYSSADTAGSFDAVITVFFIDTAPNVLRYLETIHHCLRDKGVWINIGPLLWHFEDASQTTDDPSESEKKPNRVPLSNNGIAEPGSVELSEQEVLQLATWLGFDLVSRSDPDPTIGGYIRDQASLMMNAYRCCHWIFKKMTKT